MADTADKVVKIKVIGVGGAGNNVINRMIASDVKGVEFVAVNTDKQDLEKSKCKNKVQIGEKLTGGMGAGSKPDIGQKSAEESKALISQVLEGTDMVFITAGMGGGTGTGAAPIIAQVAHDAGILTVAVVTKPFRFEGANRMKQAEAGIANLTDKVDSMIIIPNDRLKFVTDQKITFANAFEIADDVLRQAVQSISDLIRDTGFINLDFADVTAIMKDAGMAHMGVGRAAGKGKAEEAARMAISSPLLETSIEGARGVLINITGSSELGLDDVETAANIVMEAAQFPELQKFVGQELVCTDGTTLLGADDKAGIAIILQAVEELLAEKAPHGKICLGFTPDEEIGMGASFFDVSGFGADFAYTLDGGDITDYEYETFNAAKTVVTINGFSIHPGTSKDKMRNALLIAMEYNALLPALETPAHTEGYEGFFHLQEMHGKAEKATMEYIVRDHDMKRFQERKAMMDKAAEQINRRWGDGTAVVDTHDQYYNMYEVLKDHMEILELAESAMKAAGIEHPTHSPIRGGTDGSVLTYKGLLCPNLPSAGHNAHGRYEYAPVESLKTGVKTVKALVSPELVETIIGKKEG